MCRHHKIEFIDEICRKTIDKMKEDCFKSMPVDWDNLKEITKNYIRAEIVLCLSKRDEYDADFVELFDEHKSEVDAISRRLERIAESKINNELS